MPLVIPAVAKDDQDHDGDDDGCVLAILANLNPKPCSGFEPRGA